MFKFIFILIVLCPSAALAQSAGSAVQRTEYILRQLALAGLALQVDNMSNGKGLFSVLPDERTLVESLTDYGFRPDSEIGLAILLPDKSGRPDPKELVFVAAHNSVGSPALCFTLSDSIDGGVVNHYANEARPVQSCNLPATFNGLLNIYYYRPGAPKGSRISTPRRWLTYDPNTGMVTTAAP